ncbi:spore germination protein [Evansella sp. LMS18]|uniref:spore germination protein n=1 Tax=Evansella sp. LMS18 TaxID=2924033 RepID=UPI0020D090E4|nr:spore germination protein [Evansella sp. LMS18]UTR09022.1 spore germination protein [Evansella sp. LMS18]
MVLKINLKGLQINQVTSSSGLFSGKNLHINWKSTSKRNEAFGSINGQGNQSMNNHNVIFDNDYVDVYQDKKM